MTKLKCWKKLEGGLPERGIYGVNGNYVYQKTDEPKKIIEIQKIIGGTSSVTFYHGIDKKGWAYHTRKEAVKEIIKYMKEHDKC
jgi:hypothetical protein